jgi:pimeloyl-ACP methyl ester carboxylesterase
VSEALGVRREVLLSQGPIRYRERGSGEPIVFIHPMVINGDLWRKVVPLLGDRYRCITPDWPLGGHDVPMTPGTDLTPAGVATIVADFLEALDLERVTLVGNDTGGALAQIAVTHRPERVGRLMLITCDAFDNFPPPAAKPLVWLTYLPLAMRICARIARVPALQRLPFVFGLLTKTRIEQQIVDSYLSPLIGNPAVRWDSAKALRALAPEYTLEAAERLPSFSGPAVVAWNPEDHFFPLEHGRRLAEVLPQAHLEEVPDAHTFVPEDQPEALARILEALMAKPADVR